jgi:hypothetical protein
MFAISAVLLAAGLAAAAETFLCACPKEQRQPDIVFRGVAIDAALVLGPDGLNAHPRQATIFRVARVEKGAPSTPMKVWHLTDPGRCGVSFGYGATYTVRARLRQGEAETDACLMPELRKKPDDSDLP